MIGRWNDEAVGLDGAVNFGSVAVHGKVSERGAENSASGVWLWFTKESICFFVADAEEAFGGADIVGRKKFVIAKGVIDRVVEDPNVGEFGWRFVSGRRFDLRAKFFDLFGEVSAIFFMDLDSGRRDGADFVGKIVGGAVGEKRKRGEKNEDAEIHGEQNEECRGVEQRFCPGTLAVLNIVFSPNKRFMCSSV